MNIKKTADNKIEIEANSKLFALYNEVNGLVIVATSPIKKARVHFDIKNGFDMVEVRK